MTECVQIARDGHLEELQTYLSSDIFSDINIDALDSKQNSALHYAVRYSHIEIVKDLIAINAAVNIVGSDGMTPLHYAARYGKNNVTVKTLRDDYDGGSDVGLGVLKLLLKAGGVVTAGDAYKLTPLHHAAMRGNIKIVEYLVALPEVRVDARDKMGSTPLHIAATYQNTEVTRLLLAAAADVRLEDKQRQTPLHRAAQEGCVDIIEVLLSALGAECEAAMMEEDKDGNTPLTLAVEAGNSAAVQVFLAKSGDF